MEVTDRNEETQLDFNTKQSSKISSIQDYLAKVFQKCPLLYLAGWFLTLSLACYLYWQNQWLQNNHLATNKLIGALPLDLPIVKGIEDIIYPNNTVRKQRIKFQIERNEYIDSKNIFSQLFLAKSNLILNQKQSLVGIKNNQNDWNRLENKFKLSAIKTQLPMCIVVTGYNNNANFRIQYNLNSIFTQNYTNYKTIIINDASIDGSDKVYLKYFEYYKIDKANYVYVLNKKRVTALQNIYKATKQYCSNDSISVNIDADDQFIGRNVLQVINLAFQTKKAGVIYSNYIVFNNPNQMRDGGNSQYTPQQKKYSLYRKVHMKFSHLFTFQTQLIHQINQKDLQDENGAFFTSAYDMALFFPLMELSCQRVFKIEGQFQYLYNIGTGLNDYIVDRPKQIAIDNKVRAQKVYECYKPFDEKMNKLK